MNQYLHIAADVLLNPQSTYEAKQTARQILTNSGVTDELIRALLAGEQSADDVADSVFFA